MPRKNPHFFSDFLTLWSYVGTLGHKQNKYWPGQGQCDMKLGLYFTESTINQENLFGVTNSDDLSCAAAALTCRTWQAVAKKGIRTQIEFWQ